MSGAGRWLFHVVRAEDLVFGEDGRYAAASLRTEGFVHASFRDLVVESARLYFPPGADLRVLVIDPRRLDVEVRVEATPRGPMPHVFGTIPKAAVRVIALDDVAREDDVVSA